MQAKAGRGIYWGAVPVCGHPAAGHRRMDGLPGGDAVGPAVSRPSVLAVLCGVMTAGLIMGAASAGLLGALGMIFA